jgi:branched-chain amino acid transport system substrate-binding protein
VIFDDGGTRAGVRHALDVLARADLIIGPYGSDLVVEAARWTGERSRVLWNHGGSADETQRLPGVVSVPAPASRYFAPVLDAVVAQMPGARVVVAAGRGAFGRSAANGAVSAAGRLGMEVVAVAPHDEISDQPDVEVLLVPGSFADDVALIRRLRQRPPVLAAVAAGLGAFAAEVRAEGVLAPSQWEEGARFHTDAGIRPSDVVRSLRARISPLLKVRPNLGHIDYPTAQAYAVGLIALRCVQEAGTVEDAALHAVASRLALHHIFRPLWARTRRAPGRTRGARSAVVPRGQATGVAPLAGRGTGRDMTPCSGRSCGPSRRSRPVECCHVPGT